MIHQEYLNSDMFPNVAHFHSRKNSENGSRLADSSNSTKRPTGSETDQKGAGSEMNWSRTEVDHSPHYLPHVEVRFNVSPEKDEIPPVDCGFSLCLGVLELCLNSCPMDFRLARPAPTILSAKSSQ
ncbi:hypothetical protein mRhiFer1_010125 [Rhinolophus ferrumequinum]|uniref:Uncharacterized protein n=1 Tax=Rhinolophus ferrumequinum TaxID=59479 RepID=A0A7J7XPH4_RHIFE|nr:hypothetical protein mRhiFer1_010125 [Rhinolophus ferrumequinum]